VEATQKKCEANKIQHPHKKNKKVTKLRIKMLKKLNAFSLYFTGTAGRTIRFHFAAGFHNI